MRDTTLTVEVVCIRVQPSHPFRAPWEFHMQKHVREYMEQPEMQQMAEMHQTAAWSVLTPPFKTEEDKTFKKS